MVYLYGVVGTPWQKYNSALCATFRTRAPTDLFYLCSKWVQIINKLKSLSFSDRMAEKENVFRTRKSEEAGSGGRCTILLFGAHTHTHTENLAHSVSEEECSRKRQSVFGLKWQPAWWEDRTGRIASGLWRAPRRDHEKWRQRNAWHLTKMEIVPLNMRGRWMTMTKNVEKCEKCGKNAKKKSSWSWLTWNFSKLTKSSYLGNCGNYNGALTVLLKDG